MLGKYKYPSLPGLKSDESFTMLWDLTHNGLTGRYKKITPEIRARLEKELNVINELSLADIF